VGAPSLMLESTKIGYDCYFCSVFPQVNSAKEWHENKTEGINQDSREYRSVQSSEWSLRDCDATVN